MAVSFLSGRQLAWAAGALQESTANACTPNSKVLAYFSRKFRRRGQLVG